MRICVTGTGASLDAPIDPAFGRARYFLLVDSETLAVEALENAPGAHGAGVEAAQRMAERGVKAVITGNVGPNAFQGLSMAGIEIFTGATGTARQAVEAYQAGTLTRANSPTRGGHGRGLRT
ncbi:MAG: NifB/NifX family molybdenum-iron cluster-binding protein [Candidatus Bipolaricaulis sp.]|nr:NifB/NifX family molybdenum-iron cluster-binding protein [Candidatus Bipolaricaulis sp.]MDD5646581.1 NifB/NifX family molybdenum-iron cluster-binding protein [Candidatus Bipolaricaulis sp.]